MLRLKANSDLPLSTALQQNLRWDFGLRNGGTQRMIPTEGSLG